MTGGGRNGIRAALMAIPFILGPIATSVFADHAGDVAKCNAIGDGARRDSCLALITPGGHPAPAPDGQPPAPLPSAACAFQTDIQEMADCLAKPSAPAPLYQDIVPGGAYLSSLIECGLMPAGSPSRSQCLTTLGWPKDTSWLPADTYDTAYRSAINTCVADPYFTDPELCQMEALWDSILRRIQRAYRH